MNDTDKIPDADPVNPRHYRGRTGVELFDVLEEFGLDHDFYLANVIKYVVRAPFRHGVVDLRKAQVYLARAIKVREDAGA